MSSDSKPKEIVPPTYEEVIAYAVNENLFGKVSIDKFYDHYKQQGFAYHGALMDWKGKLKQWASTQRTPVTVSSREYMAKQNLPKPQTYRMGNRTTTNTMEYLEWAVAQI